MISHLVSNGPSVCMWSQDCFCASVLFHLCLCWISSVSFYWTVVLLQLLKVSPCPYWLLSLSTITTSFSFTTHFLRYWHIQWKAPGPSTFPSRTSWVTPLHCKYFSLLSSFLSFHQLVIIQAPSPYCHEYSVSLKAFGVGLHFKLLEIQVAVSILTLFSNACLTLQGTPMACKVGLLLTKCQLLQTTAHLYRNTLFIDQLRLL